MAEPTEPRSRFGRYELLGCIGRGGMAEIHKARIHGPDGFEKILVLKKILPRHAASPAFVEMLVAEAKVTATLQHANIVPIVELGQVDAQHYIAMEYVHGVDLLRLLKACAVRKQHLPPALATYILTQVCAGLDYAHQAMNAGGQPLNIIHRDVSPANVLMSFDGEIKLLDFGVARADLYVGQDPESQTGLKGKLGYMAPEQVGSAAIDHRVDIFAAGIVLFEALTLKRLFRGRTDMETLRRVRETNIDHRLARHPEIPEPLQVILRKALCRDPDGRYQKASAFQDALQDYLFEAKARVGARDVAALLRALFPEASSQPRSAMVETASAPSGSPKDEPGPVEVVERSSPTVTPSPEFPEPSDSREGDRRAGDALRFTKATFRLEADDGVIFGPIGFDSLVNLLRTHSIAPGERISVDGAPWQRAVDLALLRDLEPSLFEGGVIDPTLEGPLNPVVVADLIIRLSLERCTGRLSLTRGAVRKDVFYRDGRPVYVGSNVRSELLGSLLRREGRVSEEALEEAVAQVGRHGGQLGDALVRLGHIGAFQLYECLNAQLTDRLLDLFSWRRGWYAFVDGVSLPEGVAPMNGDALPLLVRGLCAHVSLSRLERLFAPYSAAAIVMGEPDSLAIPPQRLGLDARQLRSYQAICDASTLDELLHAGVADPGQRQALLALALALHRTGVMTFGGEEEAPASVSGEGPA